MNKVKQKDVKANLETIAEYLQDVVDNTEEACMDYTNGELISMGTHNGSTKYKSNSSIRITSVKENKQIHTIIDSIVELPQFEENTSVDFTTGMIEPRDGILRIIEPCIEVEKIDTYFIETDYTDFPTMDKLEEFKETIGVVDERIRENEISDRLVMELENGTTVEMDDSEEHHSVAVGHIHIETEDEETVYSIRDELIMHTNFRKGTRNGTWFNIRQQPN